MFSLDTVFADKRKKHDLKLKINQKGLMESP